LPATPGHHQSGGASNYYSAFSGSGKSVGQFAFANLIAPSCAKAGTLSVDAQLV
jgi:hypothetical protein